MPMIEKTDLELGTTRVRVTLAPVDFAFSY